MIEQNGENYMGSKHEKGLFVAEAKAGKTVFLVASALGLLPWQKQGGVVDKPSHLHIMTFDQGALTGVREFLQKSCGASAEALSYRVYNFQNDVRQVASGDSDYDFTLYNTIVATIGKIQDLVTREKGVHVVMASSLTRMVEGVQRGLFGPPAKRDTKVAEKGDRSRGSADENKWVKFAQMVSELRDYCQIDDWHMFWEGHITKSGPQDAKVDTLAIQGKSAYNFALNVEHVYRIRRLMGQKAGETKVDKTYLDAQPTLDFMSNGRAVNELLNPQEPDLTVALHKLGLRVGCWKPGSKQK